MSWLHFVRPLVLLALIAVAALTAGLWRRFSPASAGARVRLLMPAVALVLLVLALSAPTLGTKNRPTTFAIDHSASIDANMRSVEQRWISAATKHDCAAACHSVYFAAGAHATDLESALTNAIGLTPRGGRVVVLSDGGQTQGDALAVTGLAHSREVQLDWVRLADPRRRDAAVTAIQLPAAVHVGDTVPLSVTVHSTVAATATLAVSRNGGAPAAERIHLRAGDNPLVLDYRATRQGWDSFAASIALRGDRLSANDSSAAVVDVRPAPRVLAVSGTGGAAVPALLADQHIDVSTAGPAALPSDPGAYENYDAVVFDDVAASQLSPSQVSALDSAVRGGGLGLLVLGGPHSFSAGRYWDSPLQQVLPVTSLKPGKLRRQLAVELVLDHSGSMIDLAGGVPKIDMARTAARDSADFLAAHEDELGIIDFDAIAHTLVPMQRLSAGAAEQRVQAKIATLAAAGGTDIAVGLQAGLKQLLKSRASQRHVILMTDGISGAIDYKALLALFRRDHISVATVALGSDADRGLLARIAKATGGHAYITDDAKQLPQIFLKETQLSTKPVRVTGKLAVQVSADSPVVRSLAQRRLPALGGNVVVQLKPAAQADLSASTQTTKTSPALAQWQTGAGRVVAWTPGLGAPWGQAWLGQSALFNDALRWTERGAKTNGLMPAPAPATSGTLQIDLSGRGAAGLSVTAIAGSLTGADGVVHQVLFRQTGPALYQADVAGVPAGVYRYALSARGDTALRSSGELALSYPAEYSPQSVTTSPLAQLLARTGGRALSAGDPTALASSPGHDLSGLLVLLALIAFAAGVALRLGVASRLGSAVRRRVRA